MVLFVLAVTPVTRAHNGEPAPVPPVPVVVDRVKPPRWSWVHWWEANRERYLHAPIQLAADQAPAAADVQAQRDEVARDLIAIIQAGGRENLLVESALALGKMRHAEALPALKALANPGSSARVRTAAAVAIGLLGTPAAEGELVRLAPHSPEDRIAGLAAVGLLPNVQGETLHNLRRLVAQDDSAVGTVVAWALRQHHQDDNLQYYADLLSTSESPHVASEALLALGRTQDRRAVRLLEDVLLGYASAQRSVKAWAELERLKAAGTAAVTGRAQSVPGVPGAVIQRRPNVKKGADGKPVEIRVEYGTEQIRLAWLRSSAAVALGQVGQTDAGDALLRFVDTPPDEDEYLLAPKGFAIMSLAAYPTEGSRDRLIRLLGRKGDNGRFQLECERDNPLRGFAALALGLYARPYMTEQGPADRPGYDWAIMALVERLEDEREELEVRSACAVALGLAQRTAVLPAMHRATAKAQTRNYQDVALYGFLLLGRSLAGDNNVLEPAEGFLLRRDDDTSMSGLLTRRAAVLSLGVTRSPTAIPVLTKAWHLNHYVNREVILALRLAGASNASQAVRARLRESKDDEERAYMAQALGELLAVEQPTPLGRLTIESNYTVHNKNLLPLQRMANGFLFDFLIAAFGDQWW